MVETQAVSCTTHDGLRLHGRLYGPARSQRTILCLHGLTRNGADFDALARRLAARGERVLVFDQRGRGRSQWDPDPANYRLDVYVRDMLDALDRLNIERVVAIGTSMGGLMAMAMAADAPGRIAAMVLNDIGPEIDPRGLTRIRSYVGRRPIPESWEEAAHMAAQDNAEAFPDYGVDDWLAFARRLYRQDLPDRPAPGYDPAIAAGLAPDRTAVAPPDLWPLWDALANLPILAIRGALSDLLSAATLERMAARHPGLDTATVPNRGHAPMLDEPEALRAMDVFLAKPPSADAYG